MTNSNQFVYGRASEREAIPKFPIHFANNNCIISKVEYFNGPSNEGSIYEAIKVYIEREDANQKLIETIYPVNPNDQYFDTRPNMTRAEAVAKAETDFTDKLLHFAGAYGVDKEKYLSLMGQSFSFKEYAEKFASLMSQIIKPDVKLFVKTVPNKKGYATLPKYPPFLQPMSEGICTLSYNEYDDGLIQKYTGSKPEPGTVETVSTGTVDDLRGLEL